MWFTFSLNFPITCDPFQSDNRKDRIYTMPTGAQYQLTSSGSLALMSKIYQGDVEVVVTRVETIGM